LVVDPDAVLPGPVTFELLKAIAWRHPKVLESIGGIKDQKLT